MAHSDVPFFLRHSAQFTSRTLYSVMIVQYIGINSIVRTVLYITIDVNFYL